MGSPGIVLSPFYRAASASCIIVQPLQAIANFISDNLCRVLHINQFQIVVSGHSHNDDTSNLRNFLVFAKEFVCGKTKVCFYLVPLRVVAS
jgi:hypothetical protein